ncbi:TonB-dependent receptor [Phaeodactylibacter luteus]|uniref:TonB-dependent receptor plug domain-containing protein n=1 Tax=Phaeodactylibacter luteus TaxID=1564516 RepID=A0A5C6RMI8_9BACT|nr:carboxypeptidase-like regulatory domain-containing protein [Phaeodactylibacter luteus]TXB63608.1 hypothetical protein FRY97_08780 [Phaeodactylibacter luteus]
MSFLKPFLLLSAFALTGTSAAQQVLTGQVRLDDGSPAIGANVFLPGTYDGSVSGTDGWFQLEMALADSLALRVTYLGYEPQDISLKGIENGDTLKITLSASVTELQAATITAGAFIASDEQQSVLLRPIDIALTAGANADIAAALNTLPGTQANPEDGRLFVRGGDAREVQAYVDGMRVPRPYTSSVPDVPARGRFSPFLFKGTSFSTGGYSAAFGQGLSSALSLETKDLPEASVTSLSLTSLGVGAGHTERWGNQSFSANADYTHMGPYTQLAPQFLEWERAVQAGSLQLGYQRALPANGMLKAQATAQRSGLAVRYGGQQPPLSLDNDNAFAQTTLKLLPGENWAWESGLAMGYDREKVGNGFALDRQERTFQARTVATRYFNNSWALRFGGSWYFSQWEEHYVSSVGEPLRTVLPGHLSSSFVEAEGQLGSNWALRAGARAEYSALSGQFNAAPRVSLGYKAGAHGQWSMAWGIFHQTPAEEWLRYRPNLGAESASHYILGYQYQRLGRSLRVEGYVKDYRSLARFPEGQPWMVDNSGRGFARGLDFFYRDQASISNGDFWVSYSFLDTEREYLGFPGPFTPSFASRHNASVVYKHWVRDWQTSIGLTYTLSSPRPYDDPNTPEFMDKQTPLYQDLSFNASYLTELFGQFAIVYLSVTNVPGFRQAFGERFDTEPGPDGLYQPVALRPAAPRFFFAGLFLSIGEGRYFSN